MKSKNINNRILIISKSIFFILFLNGLIIRCSYYNEYNMNNKSKKLKKLKKIKTDVNKPLMDKKIDKYTKASEINNHTYNDRKILNKKICESFKKETKKKNLKKVSYLFKSKDNHGEFPYTFDVINFPKKEYKNNKKSSLKIKKINKEELCNKFLTACNDEKTQIQNIALVSFIRYSNDKMKKFCNKMTTMGKNTPKPIKRTIISISPILYNDEFIKNTKLKFVQIYDIIKREIDPSKYPDLRVIEVEKLEYNNTIYKNTIESFDLLLNLEYLSIKDLPSKYMMFVSNNNYTLGNFYKGNILIKNSNIYQLAKYTNVWELSIGGEFIGSKIAANLIDIGTTDWGKKGGILSNIKKATGKGIRAINKKVNK